VAACDSSATPTPGGINTPVASNSTVAPQPTHGTPSNIIAFATTGGVAGAVKLLEIDDGLATYKDGKSSKSQQLDAKTYDSLKKQITTADFFNLKDSYDKGGVADDVYYTVTVRQGSNAKTIKVAEVGGKDITPKPLQDFIKQLSDVQSSLEK
jgi:hypothetical protein